MVAIFDHAPDLIEPLLASMLDCASASLDPSPSRVVMAPGGVVAWDDCCDGQVWTRLVSLSPVYPASGQGQKCGPLLWLATIGIGVLRCAAVLDDQGVAPLPMKLNADTFQMTQDAADLSRSIQCDMASLPGQQRLSMGNWMPLGPEGGCVGGEWTVTLLVNNCGCVET